MALFDSGVPLANVALSDTFNTWRVRTNQINTQAAGLASNNTFTGTTNTFDNTVSIGSTLSLDSVNLTGVQTSGESFADNDTSIMTSAAVNDRIQSFGYSTTTGTVTSVATGDGLTGGTITGSGTLSHADTSSQSSVNNSGATVIQDVTLDTFGHVTALTSHTLTLGNLGYTGATNANYITNNNQLTNGAGYTTNTGDITGVTAGSGLTGGGSSGDVTLNIGAGTGVTVAADTVSIGQAVATSSDVRFDSFGVGTGASGTTGEIRATNNITAYYSDERLKDLKGKIPNALEKINALNGYYFTSNLVAKEFGFDIEDLQIGVSAQEVESVLPEIVTAAPFDIGQNEDGTEYSISGEDYKTVYYDKLVPLLIEAIKELNEKVTKLEMENANG